MTMMELATPPVETAKLRTWLSLLTACEKEFRGHLSNLLSLPPEDRAHTEKWIRQLEATLRIVRDGPIPGEKFPVILSDWLARHQVNGKCPSLEDLGLEPRIQRGGLRATRARLSELEKWGY